MFLEIWEIGCMIGWWLLSVFGIARMERQKSFAIGLGMGVKYTLQWVRDDNMTYKRVCENLINDLNSGKVEIEDFQ
jgi:hypothetical protein